MEIPPPGVFLRSQILVRLGCFCFFRRSRGLVFHVSLLRELLHLLLQFLLELLHRPLRVGCHFAGPRISESFAKVLCDVIKVEACSPVGLEITASLCVRFFKSSYVTIRPATSRATVIQRSRDDGGKHQSCNPDNAIVAHVTTAHCAVRIRQSHHYRQDRSCRER